MKKLFVLTLLAEVLVLAEDSEEARGFAKEAISDLGIDDLIECCVPWYGRMPTGWNENCNVYHSGGKDITVAEAIKVHNDSMESK